MVKIGSRPVRGVVPRTHPTPWVGIESGRPIALWAARLGVPRMVCYRSLFAFLMLSSNDVVFANGLDVQKGSVCATVFVNRRALGPESTRDIVGAVPLLVGLVASFPNTLVHSFE